MVGNAGNHRRHEGLSLLPREFCSQAICSNTAFRVMVSGAAAFFTGAARLAAALLAAGAVFFAAGLVAMVRKIA